MDLEEMLTLAYNTTHRFGKGHVSMTSNFAANQPQFTQEFKMIVRPSNNKIPKETKNGVFLSSAVGYKELNVWVSFGDNKDWSGTSFSWLYMDRSYRWDGERISGDLNNLDELKRISDELNKESKRIFNIEMEYTNKHGNLDGLVVEGYAEI